MCIIAGHCVPCINATSQMSEIGSELCKGYPFSATWFQIAGKRIYSLRSDKGGLDVGLIAKAVGDRIKASEGNEYGGGGHKHAAGFSVPADGMYYVKGRV